MMEYSIDKEQIGVPTVALDGEIGKTRDVIRVAEIICDITGIYKDIIEKALVDFGIDEILNNPELITNDQKNIAEIQDIKFLVSFGGLIYGADNNV